MYCCALHVKLKESKDSFCIYFYSKSKKKLEKKVIKFIDNQDEYLRTSISLEDYFKCKLKHKEIPF